MSELPYLSYLPYLPYLGVAFLLTIIALSGIRIANEYQRAVILRLGRLVATRGLASTT